MADIFVFMDSFVKNLTSLFIKKIKKTLEKFQIVLNFSVIVIINIFLFTIVNTCKLNVAIPLQ